MKLANNFMVFEQRGARGVFLRRIVFCEGGQSLATRQTQNLVTEYMITKIVQYVNRKNQISWYNI